EGRVVEPGARRLGRGLLGHLAGLQEDERVELPPVLPRRPGGERDRRGRLRRRREWAQVARRARRAVALQGGDLVHGRRRDHAGARHGSGNRVTARERRDPRRRAYLNEGGRLLYTGKYAGFEDAFGYEFQPETNAPCDPNDSGQDGCQPLSDDFLQYYLGAYFYNDSAGTDSKGNTFDVFGSGNPFSSLTWSFGGGSSANNQDHSA